MGLWVHVTASKYSMCTAGDLFIALAFYLDLSTEKKRKTQTYISLKLNPRFKNKFLIWTTQFYVVILLSSNEEKIKQMVGGLWSFYCSFKDRLSCSVTTAMMSITEESWWCSQLDKYMQVGLGNYLPFLSLENNTVHIIFIITKPFWLSSSETSYISKWPPSQMNEL